jgi:hypothetical protein
MAPITCSSIEQQARDLARDNKRAEPGIKEVYWVPDETEVRLIEVEDDIAPSLGGDLEPFYFPPSPEDKLPAPSAIALIRTDEFGKLRLPEGWGDWSKVRRLEIDE